MASKSFSDNLHQGKDNALNEEIIWRDEQLNTHKIMDYRLLEAPAAHHRHAKTKSGVTGVTLEYKTYPKSGVTHAYWLGKVVIDGAPKAKCFSIKHHGYKKAWKKAVAFRIKLTGQIITVDNPPKPNDKLLDWAKKYQVKLSDNKC